MKKIKLSFLAFLFTYLVNAQTSHKFFNSYEDYVAGKAVEGVVLKKMKDFSSSIEITENGTDQKVKASALKYPWFQNDYILIRAFDGDFYNVVVAGKLCFYIKVGEAGVYNNGKGGFTFSPKFSDSWPDEYYSVGTNGPIEKLKGKILEEYLEKNGLLSQYENDPLFKREAKDCVRCWQEKKTKKNIKYVTLLNEKLK